MKAINLLPPDLRGTPKRSGGVSSKPSVAPEAPAGIGAYVVLGALAACVLALAAYVLTTNTVKDRQAKLEATNAQAAATTQRVAQLKPYADFKAMAETRIADREGPRVLALRLGAVAARRLPCDPRQRDAQDADRLDVERHDRRRIVDPRRRSPPRPWS